MFLKAGAYSNMFKDRTYQMLRPLLFPSRFVLENVRIAAGDSVRSDSSGGFSCGDAAAEVPRRGLCSDARSFVMYPAMSLIIVIGLASYTSYHL